MECEIHNNMNIDGIENNIIKLNTTNYRLKICVNFQIDANTDKIIQYSDDITSISLLNFIKEFINILNLFEIKPKYAYFQKSNFYDYYGVILVFDRYDDLQNNNLSFIYSKISKINCTVFGYKLILDNNIVYISNKKKIVNKYYDFDWYISINSFQQSSIEIINIIHNVVNDLMFKNKNNHNHNLNYLGIGGEMGVYLKNFTKASDSFNKIYCLTNSNSIYDDFIFNLPHNLNKCYLVDYDTININDFVNYDDNSKWILVINISRHGLRNLAEQIKNLTFSQIIYIGCCQDSIFRDMKILNSKYKVSKNIVINQDNLNNYVMELIPF